MSASSRTWDGPRASSASTTTPQRGRMGTQRPVGSISAGRPRTGRHEDHVARHPPAVDDDADDLVAGDVQRGRAPKAHARTALFGQRREGVCGGARVDREADPDPARRQAAGDGRLDALQGDAAEDRSVETGECLGQSPVHPPDGGVVGGEVEEPRRLVREPEAEIGRRQVAIERHGLAVQLGEDGVERVLDDPGVRARRARREALALDQRHAGAGRREEGGGGRPDDAAADDDDIGSRLAHVPRSLVRRPSTDDGASSVALS